MTLKTIFDKLPDTLHKLGGLIKLMWIFFPLVLAVMMYLILPSTPGIAEHIFSRGLFKVVTTPIGFLTSLLPFSLTELLLILALPLLAVIVILFVRRMKRSENRKKTAVKAARTVAGFLSFTVLAYMICHGANYYRYNIETLMSLDTSQKSAEHLLAVCRELAEGARSTREELQTDENGCVTLPDDLYTELSRTGSGYDAIVSEYPFLWTSVSRQKPVMLSYLWSYTGITGMYFPMLAECNVNTEQPDFAIPFTAAHESAHSRGIAFENECNFLAFLSCINSEYPEFRYSGYMQAFKYCSNSLYSYDKELWREAYSYCSDGMKLDFTAENEYIDKFKGEVKNIASSANDNFIKAQGVSDGTLSYGRVTELILAYYDKAWSE